MITDEIRAVTDEGNPGKPHGEAGKEMLKRMNESHFNMTGWGLSFIDFKDGESILDVGCGGGMTLHRIAASGKAGHLTGVDYSETSVGETKKLNKDYIETGLMDVFCASVEELPFGDESFDKIVSVESFYFWPDPVVNLSEVRRVLKSGGLFMIIAETYNGPDMSEQSRENVARYCLNNPTKDDYINYFTSAGFKNVLARTKDGEEWICIKGEK